MDLDFLRRYPAVLPSAIGLVVLLFLVLAGLGRVNNSGAQASPPRNPSVTLGTAPELSIAPRPPAPSTTVSTAPAPSSPTTTDPVPPGLDIGFPPAELETEAVPATDLGADFALVSVDEGIYAVAGVPADDVLNVRQQPGTEFDVIGELAHDADDITVAQVGARASNGWVWFWVSDDSGTTGWAYSGYLAPLDQG